MVVFFKNIFYFILVVLILPLCPLCLVPLFPPAIHPLSSRLWVAHISSLASPFSILCLRSLCLFWTYQLCFLTPAPFPPTTPFPAPADNPPNDHHIYNSVPVLVVYLVWFFLDSVIDSCECCHLNVHSFDLLLLLK